MPFKKKITPEMVAALQQRVNQYNTVQQIRKQELGLLPNIWSAENIGMYRQRFYALQGNETGLDQISREQVVRLSRELFFQLPSIGVASELKAGYVVGNHWDFVCKSKDAAWKAAAEKFINEQWFSNCCTRGFSWTEVIRTLSRTLDMDGDVLMLYVQNKQKYPLLQFVGSHRVGSMGVNTRDGTRVTIKGKEFRCLDGIVYDEDFKVLAYAVKPDDAQISTVPQDPKDPNSKSITIDVQDASLIFNPVVFDKGRGLPSLYSSILYGLQIQDLHNFLMDIAKLEATIAYVIKNDAGSAPQEYENLLNQIQAFNAGNSQVSIPSLEPTIHGVTIQKTPSINYIKSDGGELQSFRSQRPSEEIQSYIRSIEAKLMSCIGIPMPLVYTPDSISGRAVNAVSQLVRKSVSERQKVIKKFMKRAVAWALSVAMENGYLPKNYSEDLTTIIDFTMPPEFTLDSNQDNQVNLELYKMGLISGEDYCRNNDTAFTEVVEERAKENDALLTAVEEMKKKHPTIAETTILNLFTQRGASTLKLDPVPEPASGQPEQKQGFNEKPE